MNTIKRIRIFLLVSILIISHAICPIKALENQDILPNAIETYTYTDYCALGYLGSVRCDIQVRINVTTGVCTLSGVSVEECFKIYYKYYKIVGEPTSSPERGSIITDNYVTVSFQYTDGQGGYFQASQKVYLRYSYD